MRTPSKLILLAASLTLLAAPAWAAGARIAKAEGKVDLRANSSDAWKAAKPDDALAVGAEVVTGSNSNCEIAAGKDLKSRVRLNSDSHAVVRSLEPVRIDLESGKLFALVRNLEKGSTFEVRTPTAMAAARGTGMGVAPDKVIDFEDNVYVEGTGGQNQTLNQGQWIVVNDDGTLGDIFSIGDEDQSEWDQFTGGTGNNGPNVDGDGAGITDTMFDSKDESAQSRDEQDIDKLKSESNDSNQLEY